MSKHESKVNKLIADCEKEISDILSEERSKRAAIDKDFEESEHIIEQRYAELSEASQAEQNNNSRRLTEIQRLFNELNERK